MGKTHGVLRMATFAAFYGDRHDGFAEALRCDPDVLVGDYLAELTMLVLKKVQNRGGTGYAAGFLKDLQPHLASIAERRIRVVTNAGGLDPLGCAAALRAFCDKEGLDLKISAITGDDLLQDLGQIQGKEGGHLSHLDTGAPLPVECAEVLTANAYLGAWPIVEALEEGADIVICPRVTDASLVIGPAAWRHGWKVDDWDRLAGALMAGHLIECGTQVSGGNYSFFSEVDQSRLPGMPFADIAVDGSCIIGKAPDTGGAVTIDTVKAQLLYEVGGPYYLNPDVTLDLTSVAMEAAGENLVRVYDCRGRAPGDTLKVSLCYDGGFRNTMTLGLTGRHIKEKADWVQRIMADRIGSLESFGGVDISMIGPAGVGQPSYVANTAWLTITVSDKDRAKVNRERFSNVLLSSAFSALPGCYFTTPPQPEKQIAIQWPCLVPKRLVSPELHSASGRRKVAWASFEASPTTRADSPTTGMPGKRDFGRTIMLPLGDLFGTRSGDKGGSANLAIWARGPAAWDWLDDWFSSERLADLVPEAHGLQVDRHRFPNLGALNFVLHGFLGDGAAACLRIDAQAKALGEYLAACTAPVPASLLQSHKGALLTAQPVEQAAL